MLTAFQGRLASHFADLRQTRAGTGNPVFALEHPLSTEELRSARGELSTALSAAGRLTDSHWLIWAVVAAEVGYDFSGDEYWPSLARAVPGWIRFGERMRIRDWFVRFAATYDGFRPFGPWAEHRSIISWPITHAILPNDLQSAFMREFHALRHVLAEASSLDADQLGHLFAARSSNVSSRLQCFLEQAPIVGRLVMSLGDGDIDQATVPISSHALRRIVQDLNQDEGRKIRLIEARRTFHETRLKISRHLEGAPAGVPLNPSPTQRTPTIFDAASLVATRTASGEWSLCVTLPTLQDLAGRTPDLAAALGKGGVRFFDSRDRLRPASLLLQSRLERQLRQLPPEGFSLADLELANAVLKEPIDLASAYRFPNGSRWLLRVQADERARQVLGAYVRPSQEYIIVSRQALPEAKALASILSPLPCSTQGAYLYQLLMPATVGQAQLRELDALGFGYRLALSVEPVGLAPRRDSESGEAEWLTTEEPILSLAADYDVREYAVAVGGTTALRIPVGEQRSPVLVSLGCLVAGTHCISISAQAMGGTAARDLQASIRLHVTSPGRVEGQTSSHAGISCELIPVDARLEDLLDDKARIAIVGPHAREVLVSCSYLVSRHRPAETILLGRLRLPITKERFRQILGDHEDTLLSSAGVTFSFDCGDLGRARIPVVHDTDPLRWIVQRNDGKLGVALADESDDPMVKLRQAFVAQPDCLVPITIDPRVEPIDVASPGTLFCASLPGRQYALFVSSPAPVGRLEDLRLRITLNSHKVGRNHFSYYLGVLRLWAKARVVGKLGIVRRDQIVDAVLHRLLSMACSDSWVRALARAQRASASSDDVDTLQRSIGAPGFAARLRREDWSAGGDDLVRLIDQMFEAAALYRVCADKPLITAAMTLAFRPNALSLRRSDPLANRLLDHGILMRGASFAAFLAKSAVTAKRMGG